MNVSKLKRGDKVVIKFGFENTEHTVENVVGDMVKFTPKHICLGFWTESERIAACLYAVPPTEDPPKRNFFNSWFN